MYRSADSNKSKRASLTLALGLTLVGLAWVCQTPSLAGFCILTSIEAGDSVSILDTAAKANADALLAYKDNDYEKAENSLVACAARLESEQGSELSLAIVYQNMALVLKASGRQDEAKAIQWKADRILGTLGAGVDPETLQKFRGSKFQEIEATAPARKQFQEQALKKEAQASTQLSLPSTVPNLSIPNMPKYWMDAIAKENQAGVNAYKQKQYKEAEEHFNKVLADLKGEESEYASARVYENLAVVQNALNEPEKAAASLKSAEEIITRLHCLKSAAPTDPTEIPPTKESRTVMQALVIGAGLAREGKPSTITAPFLAKHGEAAPSITFKDNHIIISMDPKTMAAAASAAAGGAKNGNQPAPKQPASTTSGAAYWSEIDANWAKFKDMGNRAKLEGKFPEAEVLLLKSIDLAEKFPQPDRRLATSLNLLAGVYRHTDRYGEAESAYQHCLKIIEATDGDTSAQYATVLDNLAQVYAIQGRYELSEPMQLRAIKIYGVVYGPNSVDLAMTVSNAADHLTNQKKFNDAEELYKKTLTIYDNNKMTIADPRYAIAKDNLAMVYSLQGKLAEAETIQREVLHGLEQTYGAIHPEIATTLNNLGHTLAREKKNEEAEQVMTRCLDINKKVFGPSHPKVVQSMRNFAEVLRYMQKNEEAARYEAEAAAIAAARSN